MTRPDCASSSSGSRGIGVRCRIDDRRGRRDRPRRLLRRRPRPADRQARPDDRRDPVPRERDRLGGGAGGPQGRRRRRGRLPRAAARDARGARGAQRPSARSRRRAGRARADDGGRAQDRPRAAEGRSTASRRRARAPSRTATSSFAAPLDRLTGSSERLEALGRCHSTGRRSATAISRSARRGACSLEDALRGVERRAAASRADRRRRLRRRLAGDPAGAGLARARGDAARGEAAQDRVPRAVDGRAAEPPRRLGAGRGAAERDLRRRRRQGARPSTRCGRVVPAARAARRRGGALGRAVRRPRARGRASWPSSSAAASPRSSSTTGCSSCARSAPTPEGFPRRREWPGSVRSPEYRWRSCPTRLRASRTRRAASARRRPRSTSPPASPRRASAVLVVDLDPQANATSGLGERANGTSSYDLLDGAPLESLAKPTRFRNRWLVPSQPGPRRRGGRARAPGRRRAVPRRLTGRRRRGLLASSSSTARRRSGR